MEQERGKVYSLFVDMKSVFNLIDWNELMKGLKKKN